MAASSLAISPMLVPDPPSSTAAAMSISGEALIAAMTAPETFLVRSASAACAAINVRRSAQRRSSIVPPYRPAIIGHGPRRGRVRSVSRQREADPRVLAHERGVDVVARYRAERL